MNLRIRSLALLVAGTAAFFAFAMPSAAHAAGLTVKVGTKPAAETTSRVASFTYSALQGKKKAAGIKFTCILDGDKLGACATPDKFTKLEDGKHFYVITATKKVGKKTLSGSATYRWLVDNRAPAAPAFNAVNTAWTNAPVTLTVNGGADVGTGNSGFDRYESQTSVDGGATWNTTLVGASRTVAAAGVTNVRFQGIDDVGNRSAFITTEVRIDKTAPSIPVLAGGSAAWQKVASVTVFAAGSTDAGVGTLSYDFRTSTDGTNWSAATAGSLVTIAAEGTTFVQFRAIDSLGNASAYTPAVNSAEATVRIDRTSPSNPTVTGGSSAWTHIQPVVITGAGSVDALSAVTYESQVAVSPNSATPTTFAPAVPGATTTISADGTAIVQVRAIDAAGNASDWAPSTPSAGSTAKIDVTNPVMPTTFVGGSTTWFSVSTRSVTATGYSDAVSTPTAEFRTSTTGAGGFPISGTPGNVANITAEGETLVQFRTRDSADNVSAWSASQIVRIDRSNPTEPNVAGGSNNWTNIAPVVITGSGATDAVSTVRYETRTRYSSDQGTTFSGASAAAAGASASITANGITVVQVRALDSADNASAWMPSIADANSTAKVDTTTPTAPTTVVGSSPSWISAASATVTASGGGDDISPSTTEYRTAFDGAAFGTAGTTGSTLSVTAEGETLVDFRTRDAANNVSPWTTTAIVRLDRTNPTDPTVAGGSDAFQNVTDVTVAASLSTDAHGPLSYRYRTSTTGTFSGVGTIGSSVTIADEGTTYVQFSVTDAAGNTTGWLPTTPTAASTIKIDRTAPTEPTVIGGSLSWGNAASVAVAASASSDALSTPTYEYRTSLNSAAYPLTGTAGDNVAVTAQGTTQVQFRAVDGAGNTSAWSPTSDDAGNTVKLDRVLPDAPTVSGGSATFQNVADVTITAASGADALSGLARYEYQTSNDGTTFAGTTTGSSAVIADEGTTYVRFRTVDVAGNLSAWIPAANSAANTVKIDRANPTVPTVTGGSAAYTKDAVTITASGSTDAGSGFDHYESETRTNGVGVWVANSNGPTVVLSLEGTYEVRFRAVDKVGRVSADSTVSAASSASIDTTAPSAPTVASTGDGSVWSTAPSVIVSGSGGTTDTGGSGFRTLQYRETVDGGTPSVAFDGTTDSVFRDGITVVQFRSIDNAGNFSAWAPASGLAGTVKLDRGVPTDPVVIGGSNNYQGTASVTISANNSSTDLYNGPVSYEYRTSFNGAAFTAAQPGHSVAITAEGVTVVQFHATDSVGNTTAWFPTTPGAGNTVKLDHTAPNTPTVTGGSNSWINAQNLVFSASGSTDDHGTVSYMVQRSTNGGSSWSTPVAASAGGTATVTAEGETLLQFAAIDGLGNTSTYVPGANTAAATARLDRSNPTAPTVAGGDTAWHSSASLPVTVTGGSDFVSSVVSYEYRTTFNGGTPSNPVSGSTVSPTAEGTTIVEYRSIDAAGNASAWTTTGDAGTVKLDRTLPSTPVVTGLGATWHATKPKTVSATAIDSISSIAGYQWSYDGTTWVATVSGSDTFALEGSNSIRFRALDQAGNVSAASTPDTLNIDTVVPTAPTAIDGSTTWQKASKTLTVSGGDGTGSTLTYEHETSTDNATWVGLTAGSTVAFSTDGRHYARFRSVDAAGNVSAWYAGAAGSNAAFIDNAAPTGLVVTGGSATYFNTDQTASAGSAVDALEGTENYYYAVDSGSGYAADVAGNSFTATTDGDYLVKFRVDDALGNTTLFSTPVALHIDKTLPSVPNSLAGGNTTWDFGRTTAAFVGTGSTDLGGGAVTYEYELVTNGGAPVTTTTPVVTAQGETLGRVRAKDRAGNYSAYFAGTAPGNTIRIDTVAPTMPTVTGGSLTFQQAARIITGSGSTDVNGTAVVSGGVVYTSEIKLNGGAFGTPINGATRSISGEGTTIVHFKATDAAGNSSAFTSDVSSAENTVNIDTTAPTAPTVTGGSAAWVAGPTQTITASTLGTDVAPGSGVARTEYQVSTDNGSTYGTVATGTSVPFGTTGERVVQFRTVDNVGLVSAWTPASPTAANTSRLDVTAPVAPVASGGSSSFQNAASVTVSAAATTDVGSGVATLNGYAYQTSTNGGAWTLPTNGTSVTITAEGTTFVRFTAVDEVGNRSTDSATTGASTVKIDRSAPTSPSATGGSFAWQKVASVAVSPTSSTDGVGSGVVSWEYRTSTTGQGGLGAATVNTLALGGSVTVSAEADTIVQFRAVDGIGFTSAWAPSPPIAGSTVRLDRTVPTNPTISGGSNTFTTAGSTTISAAGANGGLSGNVTYKYQTRLNGGAWVEGSGSSVAVTAEGTTEVEFKSIDGALNESGWVNAGADGTVRQDRTAPTVPTLSGATGATFLPATSSPVTVTAASTDTNGVNDVSGIVYESQVSLNGGAFGSIATGATRAISAEGTTIVQFRATDSLGHASAWTSATGSANNTVALDKTAPTVPTVIGGSAFWREDASVQVTLSTSTDTGGSLLKNREYQTVNNGVTSAWTLYSGAVTISAEGQTIVRSRATDNAGNMSAEDSAFVRLDRVSPTDAVVSGGNGLAAACGTTSLTFTAAGTSTDPNGSGIEFYEYRVSVNGAAFGGATQGDTYTTPVNSTTTPLTYSLQFRATDFGGHASAWAPFNPTTGSTGVVCDVP